MSQSAVTQRKLAFLRHQKQILSKPIHERSNKLYQIAEEGGIKDKVLRDVLKKVDKDVKRHGRSVYSSEIINDVVEQIDISYWDAGARDLDSDGDALADPIDEDPTILYRGEDLTLDASISKLPPVWDTAADTSATTEEEDPTTVDQDDYMEAVSRLQDLSARRLILQQKLNTYRTLLSLLEPLRKPQENIQPNLIGRDAPLAPELARTRTLAIRVAGRIGEKFGDVSTTSAMAEDDDARMADVDEQTKVENILATW